MTGKTKRHIVMACGLGLLMVAAFACFDGRPAPLALWDLDNGALILEKVTHGTNATFFSAAGLGQ